MKKILTIALVALLATASVFADFTGSAELGFGYNFEEREFGFSNSTATTLEYEITSGKAEVPAPVEEATDVAEETAEATEVPAEVTEVAPEEAPSIYAGIKGSFSLKAKDAALSLDSKVDEAYVAGSNWKVSILGAADGLDYASSSLDSYYDADAKAKATTTVKVVAAKAPGFTAEYNGWKLGAGLVAGTNEVPTKNTEGLVLVKCYKYYETAEDAVVGTSAVKYYYGTSADWTDYKNDNKTTSANWILISSKDVGYAEPTAKGKKTAKDAGPGSKDSTPMTIKVYADDVVVTAKTTVNTLDYSVYFETPEFAFGNFALKAGAMVGDVSDADTKEYLKKAELGFSAQASYKTDLFSVGLAGDVVLNGVGGSDKITPNFDGKLTASYAPATVEVYYARNVKTSDITTNAKLKDRTYAVKNLLSAKVSADLSAFEIPVSFAITGRDLINDGRGLGFSANAKLAAFSVGASFDMALTAKTYVISGNVGYTADLFSANVGLTYYSAKQLFASASIESSAILPNATLKLAYRPIEDADGLIASDLLNKKYGRVDASCKITF